MSADIKIKETNDKSGGAMGDASVSAGYAAGLLKFAIEKGADETFLLNESGIKSEALADPDGRINFNDYRRLMAASKSACADPALALNFAAETQIDKISVVGLICRASPTMGEALKQLNRYSLLVTEVDLAQPENRFQMVKNDEGLWLQDTRHSPNAFIELTESTFARFVCMFRRYYPDAPFAKRLEVTHPKPEYADAYQRVLGIPVSFSTHWNALLVDDAWLEFKITNHNPYALTLLSDRADVLSTQLLANKTWRGKVAALVVGRLHTGSFSIESIAGELGLGRQTLLRKLKAEGVTFKDLVDDVRHKMALHYIESQNVSLSEAAYLVGFSDVSGFSKAFKRWTGRSPGAARKLGRNPDTTRW